MEKAEGIREKYIPDGSIQSRRVLDTHSPTSYTTVLKAATNTRKVVSATGKVHIQLSKEWDHPKVNEQLEQPDLFDPQEKESSRHDKQPTFHSGPSPVKFANGGAPDDNEQRIRGDPDDPGGQSKGFLKSRFAAGLSSIKAERQQIKGGNKLYCEGRQCFNGKLIKPK